MFMADFLVFECGVTVKTNIGYVADVGDCLLAMGAAASKHLMSH